MLQLNAGKLKASYYFKLFKYCLKRAKFIHEKACGTETLSENIPQSKASMKMTTTVSSIFCLIMKWQPAWKLAEDLVSGHSRRHISVTTI